MTEKKSIFLRVMLISSLIVIAAVVIFVELLLVQSEMKGSLGQNDPIVALREVPSPRGNIYDVKGNLLATSMPVYTIAIDATQSSDTLFNNNYRDLATGLSEIFGDLTSSEYANKLRSARRNNKQYLRLQSGVRYSELQQVKDLPILKRGRYKGGFVYTQQSNRTKPFGYLCDRTIGYGREVNDVGIEKAFDEHLKGKSGQQMMQRINGGVWKPLSNKQDVEPEAGADVYSTIDIRMQDIAQTALLRSLEKYQAESGSVILMDVKTGAIRAISSLQRTEQEKYAENFNYAFGAAYEPGSTFKLASLLVALEDGKVDTATIVDTKNGVFKFYDKTMKDSNSHRGGHGEISLGRAFEVSSNIGIARTIVDIYEDKPQEFIDRLARLGVSNKLDFELLGEAEPWIKNRSDKSWSGVSLPWISYGYELEMSALQILALYNAVANNGELVKPYLVDRVQSGEYVVTGSKTVEILKPSICSEKTISILQDLLEGVVENGTATNIYSKKYTCAGKTGTAKIASQGSYGSEYRASFAGYFPAEKPKYSCIVVVTKPKKELGFYGNVVAAPVFSEIRNLLYAEESIEVPELVAEIDNYIGLAHEINSIHKELDYSMSSQTQSNTLVRSDKFNFETLEFETNLMPDLSGMSSMDALFLLENMGIDVEVKGKGRVRKQSLPAGLEIKQNQRITLRLS